MNARLMAARPEGTTQEQWQQQWEAAAGVLTPLAKVLRVWSAELATVSSKDFDTPNHYAKLVHDLARKQLIEDVLALLPKGV